MTHSNVDAPDALPLADAMGHVGRVSQREIKRKTPVAGPDG